MRLYEARGLLPPAPRTPAGYRTYTEHDVRLLRFIRGARSLGLSLTEIGQIVDLRRGGGRPSDEVIAAVERHLAGIDRNVADLLALKQNLSAVLTAARGAASGEGTGELCDFVASVDTSPADGRTA